jgi:serine/threonine-protein kinase
VDGEDLDSLTTRIGRLPQQKALDVARQICIGLAAAHNAGVLHRDLKPANVMLDGRGRVRITDFGLAALPEQIKAGEIRAGTPAYMAPEQIAGREVTVQSDIYAAGLVLYEVFAGKPAFQANTIQEYRELHEKARPTPLSEVVDDLPPDVDRIVARCLAKDPQDRPGSALEVAAALPGGNLLAAALAANLTPTPEMVAAARPKVSHAVTPGRLLVVGLALLAVLVVVRGISPASWVHVGSKPPSVLAEQAKGLIEAVGHSATMADSAYGFCPVNEAALLAQGYSLPEKMARLAISPDDELVFWYRQSPGVFLPSQVENVMLGAARVTTADPVPAKPGMASVVLDLSGRLLLFAATPEIAASPDEPIGSARAERWDVLLKDAGIDPAQAVAVQPRARSLYRASQQWAWDTHHPADGQRSVQVEAMTSCGRSIFFVVSQSGEGEASAGHSQSPDVRDTIATGSLRIVFVLITIVAIPSAWLNYRAGRCDRTGAMRLAVLVLVIQFVAWLLHAKHVPDFNAELLNICLAGLRAVGIAALLGVFYLALEPVARRFWPDMLITWSRALSLHLRDPILGKHVALGVCVGCFWALLAASERGLVSWLGWEVRPSLLTQPIAHNLLGGRVALAGYLGALTYAMFRGLLFVLLLAGLRALVRRPLLAAVIAGLIIAPMVLPRGAHVYTSWLVSGIGGVAVGVWVMIRYGLVTLTVALYVALVLNTAPITFHLQAWYADQSLYTLAIVAVLAAYAYVTARSTAAAR